MISPLEEFESAGGSDLSKDSLRGKKKVSEGSPYSVPHKVGQTLEERSSTTDLAQVVFDLRWQSVIQGEEIKRLRSDYFGLISSVGELKEKVAGLEKK